MTRYVRKLRFAELTTYINVSSMKYKCLNIW